MGLAIVPNLLNMSAAERYEARMNDLLDWGDENWKQFDQQGIRILLAACFLHFFTDEKPVWLWAMNVPHAFDKAIGVALGKLMFAPPAGQVAGELTKQTGPEKSLWVFNHTGALFHRPVPEIEVSLRQLADVERGEHEWHPRGIALDGRQGPKEPFVWQGRVTVISSAVQLDELQAERCRLTWPIAQNCFVNVRFRRRDLYLTPFVRDDQIARDPFIPPLRTMILNLMDFDFRNTKRALTVPPGLFEPLTYLATVVTAFRGPGFDGSLLLTRSAALACAHARMLGKSTADREDFGLARKILLDAIPPSAVEVLRGMPLEGYWTVDQLKELCGQTPARTLRAVEALHKNGSLLLAGGEVRDRDGKKRAKSRKDYYSVTPELGMALMAGL